MKKEDYFFIGFITVALVTFIYFSFANKACAGNGECSPKEELTATPIPSLSDTPSATPSGEVSPAYTPPVNASNSGESYYPTSRGGSGVSDGLSDGRSDGKSDGRSDGLCSLPPCITPGAVLPQSPPSAGRAE